MDGGDDEMQKKKFQMELEFSRKFAGRRRLLALDETEISKLFGVTPTVVSGRLRCCCCCCCLLLLAAAACCCLLLLLLLLLALDAGNGCS